MHPTVADVASPFLPSIRHAKSAPPCKAKTLANAQVFFRASTAEIYPLNSTKTHIFLERQLDVQNPDRPVLFIPDIDSEMRPPYFVGTKKQSLRITAVMYRFLLVVPSIKVFCHTGAAARARKYYHSLDCGGKSDRGLITFVSERRRTRSRGSDEASRF